MQNVIMNWNQKLKTRIPSWMVFLSSARRDKRQVIYMLLPLITSPDLRRKLALVWSIFKPSTINFKIDKVTERRLDTLRCDGLVSDMPAITEDQLSIILNFFKSQPCHDPYRLNLGQFSWDKAPSNECNMAMYTVEQIVKAPYVMQLFNHPEILNLAEAYLGCKPTLDNISCWWSYGERTNAKGTQRFHRDFDSIGGFKVFFYLTNVGSEQGPHEYIIGSHTERKFETGAAISDDLLWRQYERKKACVITGKAGTSFVADTFGIHRGQLPISGKRLILSAQYNINISPHGPKQPIINNKSCLTRWICNI
jgi:hypothetical protein